MATFLVAHGAWSAGWAWKKMHPLLRARGHELFTPPDTSEIDLSWVNAHRVMQPLKTFEQKIKLTGAVDKLPRTYIYCTKSRPGGVFRQFRDRASSEKGWKCIDIDASHSPHVTAPDELIKCLLSIASVPS